MQKESCERIAVNEANFKFIPSFRMTEANFDLSFHSEEDLDDSFKDPDYVLPKDAATESSSDDNGQEEDVVVQILEKKKNSRVNGNQESSTAEFLENNQPTNSKRSCLTAITALKAVVLELHPDC